MRNDPPPGLHKRIGKVTGTMLGFEDHDIFTAMLDVDYGGSGQGVGGHILGLENDSPHATASALIGRYAQNCSLFIRGVLRAAGVRRWELVKGRTLFVLFETEDWNAKPVGLAPLPTEPGETFYFSELA